MVFTLPQPVEKALLMLREAGFPAYTVGGCVRDRVLGMIPHDYDICTAATPPEMQRVFAGERTLETGIRHGTLTVLMDEMPLEITTFRLDGEYLDGRHPAQVSFTTRIGEDLSRRDFTMNAMAYSPWDGLIDPFGGQRDCESGIIRCVGEAKRRFDEDALRILRALRFSARLGFPIEEETALCIHRQKENLQKISRERIFAEMTGILQGGYVQEMLFDFSDVMLSLFPALGSAKKESAWRFTLRMLPLMPKDEALRWAAFLQSCEGDAERRADTAESILRSLKASNALMSRVKTLLRWLDEKISEENMQEMLMHLGAEDLKALLQLREAYEIAEQAQSPESIRTAYQGLEKKAEALLRENACYSLGQLAVNGRDLAVLGYQGPQIGQMLQSLLEKVVKGKAENEKETLLLIARRQI